MSEGQELRSVLLGPGRRACGVDSSATSYANAHSKAHGAGCNCNSGSYTTTNPASYPSAYRGGHTHACDSDSCACFVRGKEAAAHGRGSKFREADLESARRAARLALEKQGE